MTDRDVSTIRNLIHYQYATIIAKSAFAASDGESSLKHRADRKLYDSNPPLLPSAAATTAQARPTLATWTGWEGESTVAEGIGGEAKVI